MYMCVLCWWTKYTTSWRSFLLTSVHFTCVLLCVYSRSAKANSFSSPNRKTLLPYTVVHNATTHKPQVHLWRSAERRALDLLDNVRHRHELRKITSYYLVVYVVAHSGEQSTCAACMVFFLEEQIYDLAGLTRLSLSKHRVTYPRHS